MRDRNAYFQLSDGQSEVKMKYYPPIGNGENLTPEQVSAFLDARGVKEYDFGKVVDLLSSVEEAEGVISKSGCMAYDEVMELMISQDKMYAIARFYPASTGGKRLSRSDIMDKLEHSKIVFGINSEQIDSFVNTPMYCYNYVLAKGEVCEEGKDAVITYFFQTDRKAKPQLKEDGTVDFHNLNNISNVKAGDVLAELTPEDMGKPGTDIFGAVAKPKKVAKLHLKHGNNIKLTEDGLRLISEVDGHATLEDDKVFVSNNYEVPADVDNSTGDIAYNGSVTVKGNVRTGFKVEAKGNVEVFGVVEGATIIAEGDIVLHRGIQGMGKSDIRAKGNIISKFIESADVMVEGFVETDTILNSNVTAKGEIYVRGKSASLIGGNVRSASLIEAANIGSPMGTATNVEVGTDPTVRDMIKDLKAKIEAMNKENDKYNQLITMMRKKQAMGVLEEDKISMLQQMTKTVILNNAEIKSATLQIEQAEKELNEDVHARIRGIKAIHAGTRVTIAGDYIFVHNDVIHSEFKRVRGEIKTSPL